MSRAIERITNQVNKGILPTGHNTSEFEPRDCQVYVEDDVREPPESVTTVGAANANSWWNSQLFMKESEFRIQFGTFSKEAYDRVAKVCAEIMDEEYHAKRL